MRAMIEGEYLSIEAGEFKGDDGQKRPWRSLKVLQDDSIVRVSLPADFDESTLPEPRSTIKLEVDVRPGFEGKGMKTRLSQLLGDVVRSGKTG